MLFSFCVANNSTTRICPIIGGQQISNTVRVGQLGHHRAFDKSPPGDDPKVRALSTIDRDFRADSPASRIRSRYAVHKYDGIRRGEGGNVSIAFQLVMLCNIIIHKTTCGSLSPCPPCTNVHIQINGWLHCSTAENPLCDACG